MNKLQLIPIALCVLCGCATWQHRGYDAGVEDAKYHDTVFELNPTEKFMKLRTESQSYKDSYDQGYEDTTWWDDDE